MSLYNLARVYTATTGTGTLALGAAVSGFLTFTGAGVVDGSTVSYGIRDDNHSEVGRGVWDLATNTLTRATVLNSTAAGAKINLSGSAEVFITALAQDFVAGITGAGTLGYLAAWDSTSSVTNATNTDAQVSAAVTASHARAHALDSSTDHTIGSLTSGRVVASNGTTLVPAALIAPASNVLTLSATAASELALNIASGKVLTLVSADSYSLTIPKTGSAIVGTSTLGYVGYFSDANTLTGSANLFYQTGASPNLLLTAANAVHIPLVIKLAGSHTADAVNIINSSNVIMTQITKNGKISINPTMAQESELVDALIVNRRMVDLTSGGATGKRGFTVDTLFYNSTNSSATYEAFNILIRSTAGNLTDFTQMTGFNVESRNVSGGRATSMYGGLFDVNLQNAGSALEMTALYTGIRFLGTGDATDAYCNYISATKSSTGKPTNMYGIYISDITIGATINSAITTNAGDIVFNAGGNALGDFTHKTDNYNSIFSDASNDSIVIMSSALGKLGFFAATAITQPTSVTDLGVVLSDLGLRAAGTAYPITTTGAVTLASLNAVSFDDEAVFMDDDMVFL